MKEGHRKRQAGRPISQPRTVALPATSPFSKPRRDLDSQASPRVAKPVSFKSVLWISLALIAAILIVYSPVWHYGFLSWDDPLYVSKNIEVSRGLTWHSVFWAFTTGHSANWHPLTWLSHMLDIQLYGMAAELHHLTNILLHIANTLLLFWVLCRMTGAWRQSAMVAVLFAVHPLHVESVAWIAERKDVLSTLFWMLALHAYVSYVHQPRLRRYLVVIAVFTLGLTAKPMLVTLPLTLLLLDIWPLRRARLEEGQRQVWWQLAREKISLLVLAIGSSIATIVAQWRGGTVKNFEVFPLSTRTANALVSYVAYIGEMLWPRDLVAYYPYEPLTGWWVAGSILVLIFLSFVAFRLARRYPYLLVGWLWYLCTLMPVIGLIQVGDQSRADRYTYVPLVGLFIIVAWGIPKLLDSWRFRSLALQVSASIVICVLMIASRNQVRYWKSDLALWEHTVQKTTSNYFARTNLGFALADSGDIAGAISQYTEALRIKPSFPETHNALGVVLVKQGLLSEAMAHYTEALRLKPDFADAHSNLGMVLAIQGKTKEAISEFLEALRIRPDNAEMHYNLGFALDDIGKTEEAIAQYDEALRIKPEYAEVYLRLGNAFFSRGKINEAITHYTKALHLKPDFAEAHNNIGFVLMSEKKADEAVIHYRDALRIKPDFAEAHNNLGLALMNQEQIDEAIIHFTEALRIKPGSADLLNNLGSALLKAGRYKEASAYFTEALRIMPDDVNVRKNLEIALANQKSKQPKRGW